MIDQQLDFSIDRLGECRFPSPMRDGRFTDDGQRLLYHSGYDELQPFIAAGVEPPALELAGPRDRIYFDPTAIACGIVTCGGLCPGTNDVIRAVTLSLYHHYGVRRIHGFRYGYEGLIKSFGHTPLELNPTMVNQISNMGGTILSSSRGPQDPAQMVDYLEELGVGILFAIGGDGTLKGAGKIAWEAARRGSSISVIGIPKTIDNDISFIQSTFGFETAVAEAHRAIYAAHAEATGARNGIGLVKLMGRDSGFIAAYSTLVDSQVNFCLVPESAFSFSGLLKSLEERLTQRGHAVIVVAEGAGQELLTATAEHDASGNLKLGDIGMYLRDAIKGHFAGNGIEINLKYIDPSYIIRSQPANPHDSALCLLLGHNAVHAGMSGRTNMVVGVWNHQYTHVPIALATRQRKKIDPEGWLWNSVLASTGQPRELR
ncbi:MAG: diphosphate--fructose-6-phosphate 1-phosphotransferase [Geobacteraceae bacterium GWC2_55_20]|nr:MAG: diphosphate--fructose-6-phosphate 1-phosphotransferase [Geobacteraceae bacterium GWC2_55_20]OGU24732.1 MAG: diphosphate--fructose-6-phosphate 1-phosphotransferase [Geobacteraceae bacterium GWF2_54_21]HCE69167.1 ATP-dependent 6-phosphofructokinase [Geobacter sp.]